MNPSPSETDAALLDVRKAYRLLHQYQRLALDAVSYIAAQFGFSYQGGWPKYTEASPKPGKGKLDQSAWDWLNMYLYEFYFEGKLADGTALHFSVLLISDSGYYQRKDENTDYLEVETYLPAAKSSTRNGLQLCAGHWPEPKFMADDDQMRVFIESGGDIPEDYESQGVVARCYDFTRLLDEKSTNQLLDDFIAHARAKGIPLERTAKG